MKDTIRFTANSIKISDIKASVHYDGSPRIINDDGSTDAENVVYITSLDTNETGVKFTLYIDGKPIDKAYATAIKDLFAQSLNLEFENYKIFVCDDGGIVVSPTATKMPALIYWFLHRGDTVIETRYDGITASEVICFKIGDMEKAIIEFVLILILIIGLIYVVYWMFGKPHFHRADIKMFVANREYGTYLQDYGKTRGLNWLSASGLFNFIGPFGMKKKVGNFSVRSVKGGYELLGVKGRYVSTSITYPSANTGITECKKNTCRFSSSVYVYDNTRYYKIMISK